MDLEYSAERGRDLGEPGDEHGRIRVFLIFFPQAKLLVDQGDDRVFTQVMVAIEVPLGADFFAGVPSEGHVGAEDRQPHAGAVIGRAGVVQVFPQIGLLAR